MASGLFRQLTQEAHSFFIMNNRESSRCQHLVFKASGSAQPLPQQLLGLLVTAAHQPTEQTDRLLLGDGRILDQLKHDLNRFGIPLLAQPVRRLLFDCGIAARKCIL